MRILKNMFVFVLMAILLFGVSMGGTFALLTTSKKSTSISVNTGKLSVFNFSKLSKISGILPGETSKMINSYVQHVTNDGTRDCIAEISFKEGISGIIPSKNNIEEISNFPDDYYYDKENESYVLSKKRIDETVEMFIDLKKGNSDFILVDGNYYAKVKARTKNSAKIGEIYLKTKNELGGGVIMPDGSITEKRQFENGVAFENSISVTIASTNKDACIEAFGKDVVNKLPPDFFN